MSQETAGEANGGDVKAIVWLSPPPPRWVHHAHRWAWCEANDGRTYARCYDCGVLR